MKILPTDIIPYNKKNLWLGLKYNGTDETWHWEDGLRFDYTNWQKDEPKVSDEEELCVEVLFSVRFK